MTDLTGVRVKLARARHHADNLDQLLRPVLEITNQAIVRQDEDDPTEAVYRITWIPSMNPVWAAMIGDSVCNLRSALDHLAWQLVLLDGGTPNKSTQMPLHDKKPDGTDESWLPDIRPGIKSTQIRNVVDAIQPYKGGGRWVDQFSVINELSRIDKHRLLITVAMMLNPDELLWGLPAGVPSPKFSFPVGKPLESGDVVARFNFKGARAPSGFDPHLTLQIGLSEGPESSEYRFQGVPGLLRGLEAASANRIDTRVMHLFTNERPIWIYP